MPEVGIFWLIDNKLVADSISRGGKLNESCRVLDHAAAAPTPI
jgi:hypothetical protein